MNKSELIREIANKAGITIKEATASFDAFLETLTESLKNGDRVQISGFGSYELKKKPAREGVNPKDATQKIKIIFFTLMNSAFYARILTYKKKRTSCSLLNLVFI